MVAVEVHKTGRAEERLAAIKLLREATGYGLAEAAGCLGRLDWDGQPFSVELPDDVEAQAFAQRLAQLGNSCRLVA